MLLDNGAVDKEKETKDEKQFTPCLYCFVKLCFLQLSSRTSSSCTNSICCRRNRTAAYRATIDHLINQSVLHCFTSRHKEISFCVLLDAL